MTIESLVDYSRKYIEKAIISGVLSPGQQIREEYISSRLEISRPPIRQAFEILIAEGLATRKPRRGVFVSDMTEKDVWEVYTLKACLYEFAFSLAIDDMTDEDIAELENVIHDMEECIKKEPINIDKYQDLNMDFHINIILDISGHERLRKIMDTLENQTKRMSFKNLQDRDYLLSSFQYHKQIFEAIKLKDKVLFGRLCRKHIFRGMRLKQKAVKELQQK